MSNRYDDRRHGRQSRSPDDQQSTRLSVTDQEIQKWISRQHGFVPESAWIAHCKELFGLAAPGSSRDENPCPQERWLRLSRHSGTSDCSERLAKKKRLDPEQYSNFIARRWGPFSSLSDSRAPFLQHIPAKGI